MYLLSLTSIIVLFLKKKKKKKVISSCLIRISYKRIPFSLNIQIKFEIPSTNPPPFKSNSKYPPFFLFYFISFQIISCLRERVQHLVISFLVLVNVLLRKQDLHFLLLHQNLLHQVVNIL